MLITYQTQLDDRLQHHIHQNNSSFSTIIDFNLTDFIANINHESEKKCEMKRPWPMLRNYPRTDENYEELQDMLSSGHESNLGPSEYISPRR
jgi:hypothetical protein